MGTFDDKTKNYFLTYNATIYLFDMVRYLRKSVYSSIAIDYLAAAIVKTIYKKQNNHIKIMLNLLVFLGKFRRKHNFIIYKILGMESEIVH